MGRVYLALDPNIDRKIALKVLEPLRGVSAQEEEELRRRFVLEARAAGRLKHPGIVTVYDAETDPTTDRAFIAMEWVEGRSLEQLLGRSGRLPTSQAVAVVDQVAVALDSAHREGLVHRDIKPANILLDVEGRAKLTDFGIAKFTSMSNTVAGRILGSPYYMSPEQIRNESIDGRSDLFSLGVVLYQSVTGAVPFDGESLASITYKILEIDPRPPRSLNPAVTEALSGVIDRALDKPPSGRFQTGLEFSRALRAVEPRAAEDKEPATVDAGALPARPASSASLPTSPRKRGTGTVLLPAPGPGPDASTDRASRREGGLEALVEEPSARIRNLRTPLSNRFRIAVAALLALAVLGLLTFLRPREPEPPVQAVRTMPGETPKPSRPAEVLVPEATQSPVPSGWATLEVNYRNRLRSANLTIWIDGEKTWSQRVTAPKGLLKRASGREVRAILMVTEGGHVIQIRVEGSSGKVRATKRIEAVFEQGQTRRLGVALIPPDWLKLSWKE